MWNWYQEVRRRLQERRERGEPLTAVDASDVADLLRWADQDGYPVVRQNLAPFLEAAAPPPPVALSSLPIRSHGAVFRPLPIRRDPDDASRARQRHYKELEAQIDAVERARLDRIKIALTRKIKQENLIKQKAKQRGTSYLCALALQRFKQLLGGVPSTALLQRVDRVLADSESYRELISPFFTQICLQEVSIDAMPKFWGRRTIYTYLWHIFMCQEPPNAQAQATLRNALKTSDFCDVARGELKLKQFGDTSFMERWGSKHQAWPLQLKWAKKLGYPLPGCLKPVHREYYVLPPQVPDEVSKKWGGFRVLMSIASAGETFFHDAELSVRENGIHFVYFTDSHYGDDGDYVDLNLPGHVGPKPYYLIGVLEFLLLDGADKGYVNLGAEADNIRAQAWCAFTKICKDVELFRALYAHVDVELIVGLLGVPLRFLEAQFAFHLRWLRNVLGE